MHSGWYNRVLPRTTRIVLCFVFGVLPVIACQHHVAVEVVEGPTPYGTDGSRASSAPRVEFLGLTRIAPEVSQGAVLGGLSGLVFDSEANLLYVVSDDKSQHGPVRYYSMRLDLESPQEPIIEVVGWTELRGLEGVGLDLEGISLSAGKGLYVLSEGLTSGKHRERLATPPFVGEFDRNGELIRRLMFPASIHPSNDMATGIRSNLGPEALTRSPGGRFLFAGVEGPLKQDDDLPTFVSGSTVRILRFDLESDDQIDQFLYSVEPLHVEPPSADTFRARGLVELLALEEDQLLVLERSFVEGLGNAVQLYWIDLDEQESFRDLDSITGSSVPSVVKELVVDFEDLGVPLDNYEGLSFGPDLPDGRRSLVVISDDNFNPATQSTWVLVFALADH